MKILVTGIAGFIGSHLAERLLLLGHTVTGIDNFSNFYDSSIKKRNAQQLKHKGATILNSDLRDVESYSLLPNDFEYIFHCAAQSGISDGLEFNDYLTNNFIATQRLLTFSKKCSSLLLFVNLSTSSVYGTDVNCDEKTVAKPISNYGVTKLAAEQLVLADARNGHLKATSLRLYSVYGSRERPDKMFNRLITCGLNGTAFPLFSGSKSHRRSFTHVRDIIDGIASVIGKNNLCNREVFNLGNTKDYSTLDGINTVEHLLNTSISITQKPARQGDQLRTKAVIDKATSILGYTPKTCLEEGVKEQILWTRIQQKIKCTDSAEISHNSFKKSF